MKEFSAKRILSGEQLMSEKLPTVSRPTACLLIGVKANRIGTLIHMRALDEIVVSVSGRHIRLVTLDSIDSYLNHRRGEPAKNLPFAWSMIVDATRMGKLLTVDDFLNAFKWSLKDPHARTRLINLLAELTIWSWDTHRMLAGLMVIQSQRARRPHQKILGLCRRLLDDTTSDDEELIEVGRAAAEAAVFAGTVGTEPSQEAVSTIRSGRRV